MLYCKIIGRYQSNLNLNVAINSAIALENMHSIFAYKLNICLITNHLLTNLYKTHFSYPHLYTMLLYSLQNIQYIYINLKLALWTNSLFSRNLCFTKITDFTDNLVYNLRSIRYKIKSKANRSGRLMFLHGSCSTWTRTGGRRNVRFNCRGMCTDLILVVTQSDFSSVKEEKRVCLVALVKNKTLPSILQAGSR